MNKTTGHHAAGATQLRLTSLVTLAACAIVGVTVLLQLLLLDHFSRAHAAKEAELRLQQLSWQMRDTLNRVVAKAVGDVQLLAELPQVRDATRSADARAALESLQRTFPDYAWIGIADLDGKLWASTQGLLTGADVGQRRWFKDGQLGLRAVDYHPAVMLGKILPRARDPWRFVDVAGPVRDRQGALHSVLGVHLSWDWARRQARQLLTPALREYGAEIVVVQDDGTVLLGPDKLIETKVATDSIRLAQLGGTGSVRETWPDGVVYRTGYSRTGTASDPASLQWTVLVRQTETTAMADADAMARRILLLSAALAVLLAALAVLLARRLARPLDQLSVAIEAATAASDAGTAPPPIPAVSGFREAQVLSGALRALVHSEEEHRRGLESMNQQLESTVAARTAELQAMLMTDVLTGLPNRRALLQALPEAMGRAKRLGRPCAVLFLDMDGFKRVNDSFGHKEGDELLRQVGARLTQSVRKTDLVARLAGDEFVVILELLVDAGDAEHKARAILARLQGDYVLKTTTVAAGGSMGLALHLPDDAPDLDALLGRADHAMYAAKRNGKNCLAFG